MFTDIQNKKLEKYTVGITNFTKDSAKYSTVKNNYDTWIKNEKKNTISQIKHYEKLNFNRALTKYLARSNSGDSIKYNVLNTLRYSNYFYKDNQEKIKKLNTYLCYLNRHQNLHFGNYNLDFYLDKMSVSQLKYLGKNKRLIDIQLLNANFLVQNSFSEEVIRNNKYINDKIREEKLKNIVNKTSIDNADLSTIYNANITQLGFINCDRFTQNELVEVDIKYNKNEQVYFSIKSMNTAYCPHNKIKNKYFLATMPKNIPVTMIVMRLENGKPMFEKRDIMFNEYAKIETNPKPVTTKEMMGELANL